MKLLLSSTAAIDTAIVSGIIRLSSSPIHANMISERHLNAAEGGMGLSQARKSFSMCQVSLIIVSVEAARPVA